MAFETQTVGQGATAYFSYNLDSIGEVTRQVNGALPGLAFTGSQAQKSWKKISSVVQRWGRLNCVQSQFHMAGGAGPDQRTQGARDAGSYRRDARI